VAQTTTVHHDAEGQYQQVAVGTQKTIICECKEHFSTTEDWKAHKRANDCGSYSVVPETIYETQWFEICPAWDETVTTGYICSVCGTAQ
jgi:hypothetical protein